jgi:glucose-6-phosphate isomerase
LEEEEGAKSFDASWQGKALAQRIIPELESPEDPQLSHDSSTNTLIRRYRKLKEAS